MEKAIGLLLAIMLLVGCGGDPADEPMARDLGALTSPATESELVAESVIEPARWSTLGFGASGEVVAVVVEEGDWVEAGDLLIQVDRTDAELAVRQAEVALQAAQVELALLEAGPRPEEITFLEAQLEAAEARLLQASAQQDYLLDGTGEVEIAAAEAEIAAQLVEGKRAQDAHTQAMKCFEIEIPHTGEKQEICPGLGPREEQARAAADAADELLVAAEAKLRDLHGRPDGNEIRAGAASVQSAAASRDAAQAQLDLALAGPSNEEIAVAASKLMRARVALEAAQAALAQTEVRAPFAGAVSMVSAEVGNVVIPGQVASKVATVGQLQARTKDLSELDVAGIEPGQSVTITVDAMPEHTFEGVVRKVALRAEDFRGQAVFSVIVDLLDRGDAPLRWGMTAWVEFGA